MRRTTEERRAFWREMEAESRGLGGPGFQPDVVAAQPLWWEGLPRVRPA